MGGHGELGRIGLWASGADAMTAAELGETARSVEAAGITTLWLPEGIGRDSLLAAAIALSATTTLHVGTDIAVTWSREPVLMVAGQQSLSEWFPGRFTLGIGVSHGPMNAMRNLPYHAPLAHLHTYLDALEAVAYGSVPAPSTRTLLGAQGPKMLAVASERLDGALPYLVTPEHTATARSILGAEAVLAPEQGIVLTDDRDEALGAARANLAVYLDLPNYTNNWKRLGYTDDDLAGGGSERLIDGLIASGGDPARDRIDAHLDAGADHVVVQVLTADWARLTPDTIAQVAALTADL